MYNALTGMGGGGTADTFFVNEGNTALSVTFTVCSLLGAPIYNIFGHWVLLPAGLCYVLYTGSFLTPNGGFTIAAAAILGIGAGFLWTAQAGIMMSYPSEDQKGRAFGIFWMVFNLGATMGGAILLGLNYNSTGGENRVTLGTYIGFMVIMAFGALLALTLAHPSKVLRGDGARVSLHKYSNVRREAWEVFKLFTDWRMLILIPLFIGSNWFYTYQFQVFNGGGYFDIRGRALNNFLYWLFQIFGGGFIGWLCDRQFLGKRRQRAFVVNTFVLCVCVALWAGATAFQRRFDNASILIIKADPTLQMTVGSPGYGGICFLYAMFGFMDSIYQGFAYWLMGTLTNDTERAARYGGFYKTIQNIGGAAASQVAANNTNFMTQLIIVFVINVVGLLLSFVVCWTVPDTTVEEIDNLEGVEGKETVVGGHLENDPVEKVEA
ncbi:MFS general substrate transporter [Hesseltinella vesiculosa]|uniref:MFS general substrate transporter n=1 Tax=Hesseltinella vesiculosa TaxID=101127 RepID=A0A1X2GY76_9FUNG|nr:MFS general substrate transporter [Hesseltinella vesiculosa]